MGRIVAFDIETNGLLDKLDKLHCLCIGEVGTDRRWSLTKDNAEEGLKVLMEADLVIGHNIIKFDIPAIQKLYPEFHLDENKVFDTLVASRLIWSDLYDRDWGKLNKGTLDMPANLAGAHKLEAWGYRLGDFKGEYSEIKRAEAISLGYENEEEIMAYIWSTWSQDMQDYCDQDVEVTLKFYNLICKKNYAKESLDLEHAVQWIIADQERNGFMFNIEEAEKLAAELIGLRAELRDGLTSLFPAWYVPDGGVRTPKRPNSRYGYWGRKEEDGSFTGFPYSKIKQIVFNPGSRDHIADRLMVTHGWKPKAFTNSGKVQVDETILEKLPYPEAKQLTEFMLLQKRIGQLAEGDKAWLKYVGADGRIHGSVITNGAVTGRATHSHPNIAQVPAVGARYGAECRALFTVPRGRVLLGCDASGLELRMLAHYMARHDGGSYAREVLEGDVHWTNVRALGLVGPEVERDETGTPVHKLYRNGTKTFIYGFLYGAGDLKVALILLDMAIKERAEGYGNSILDRYFHGRIDLPEAQLKAIGSRIKAEFLAKTPALRELIGLSPKEVKWLKVKLKKEKAKRAKGKKHDAALIKSLTETLKLGPRGVKKAAETKGYLKGLDGRLLHVRSSHAALNTLLQSAGAIVCKKWMVIFHQLLKEHGLHNQVWQVAWVHDELQIETLPEIAERVGDLCVEAIRLTGKHFDLRIALDGEYSTGQNWKETH